MPKPNRDKEQIVALTNRLLYRSGLSIDQTLARMQAHGCALTRSAFENAFTTRVTRPPNIPPQWTLALIVAFTERLTDRERCTAAEAVELARLARLPIDQFKTLKNYFPEAEFIAAYTRYVPAPGLAPEDAPPAAAVSGKATFDARCPYQGLRAFGEEQAEFFFGRAAEIEKMLERLQQSRFLAVIGPSGVGKSSAMRAGLMSALRQGAFQPRSDFLPSSDNPWQPSSNLAPAESGSEQWLIQLLEPGRRPLESLAVALLKAGQTEPPRNLRHLLAELETDERGLHLLALELLARQPGKTHLALVVDQFEELFTLCQDEAARRTFIANLLHAASLPDGQTVIIMAMRADFYSQAALHPELAACLAERQVLISPMAEPQLAEAITHPAQKVGLHFEPAANAEGKQILASGDEDEKLFLWDAASGQPLGQPFVVDGQRLSGLAFSPDGQTLAVSSNNLIILWDTVAGQPIGQPLSHDSIVEPVAFSPDGQLLASGRSDGAIILWDLRAPQPNDAAARQPLAPPFSGHTGLVSALAFSPDGKILASGSHDQTVRLWDAATRRLIRQPLIGHTGPVKGVAFSPNGQTLASGGIDGAIVLWDVAAHQALGPPLPVSERIFSLAFSPDGRTLAISGGDDNAITLWEATPEAWREYACRLAGRNLSADEWKRYFGDEPYRATCPNAPFPDQADEVKKELSPAPTDRPAPAPVETSVQPNTGAAIIQEDFESGQGFIQTSPNVYIDEGQIKWHIQRSGGQQYLYRSIPPFSGNARLTVRGQVEDGGFDLALSDKIL